MAHLRLKRKEYMVKSNLEEMRSALAANVRELRMQRGLSQERLALEADVDRTLVSKIERVIANPTLDVLARLAAALEVPFIRLFKS
jgi:transcriptional regulator with XRE-family HTH domain